MKKALRGGETSELILGGPPVRLRGKTGGAVAVLIPPVLIPLVGFSRSPLSCEPWLCGEH